MKAQANALSQVFSLADRYKIPVLHAGDVLDRWNATSELLNFCLEHLGEVWAVPGNHDLPNHSLAEVKRSGYWTLVQAGRVKNVGRSVTLKDRVRVWGFPWGTEPVPCPDPHGLYVEVCLCHKYMWTKNTGYPGAPESGRVSLVEEQFKGYDFVISGDNHNSFCVTRGGTTFINTGSLLRRTSDQADFLPRVWLLYANNTAEPVYLKIDGDVFEATGDNDGGNREGAERLARELSGIGSECLDFDEVVERVIRKGGLSEGVVREIRWLLA